MIKREVEKSIKEVNDTFRVMALTGPRQVGKTTILKSLMSKDMKIVSLDNETYREEAKNNPKFFLETWGKPLFIDEAQYAPELFPYIKMIVDDDKKRGQFWLSGSQSFELMKGVSESLAGRVGIIKMNSLTYKEITNNVNDRYFNPDKIVEREEIKANEIFEYIFKGGLPELYDIPGINRDRFFRSYVDTYIDRDVRLIRNIGDLVTFEKFMRVMAIRNGKTLVYEDIASDVGVSAHTIKSWVSVLVTSGIVYLLEPYHNKKIQRLTHMPKIIFMDSGLACYLAGWTSAKELQISKESGNYFETYVISEIIKQYENNGVLLNITHFRNKETDEIDLLIEKNMTIYPIEIKKTSTPKREMLRNFEFLTKNGVKVGNGGIVCLCDKLFKVDEKKYYIPLSSVIDV